MPSLSHYQTLISWLLLLGGGEGLGKGGGGGGEGADVPTAPANMTGFRPSLSMYKTAGMVARNMATPTTPVARREVVLLLVPRAVKMLGA